mgnify:CR=1 FL=1
MKKHLGFLASILAILLLGGCGPAPVPHQHTFSNAWSYDENKHWHPATCEHKELKDSEDNHSDSDQNGLCDVCGYRMSDWTDEQKNIFNNHLYGYQLPFITNGNLVYDINQDCVVFTRENVDEILFQSYVNSIVLQDFHLFL